MTITGTDFIGDAPADTVVSFDGGAGVTPGLVLPGVVSAARCPAA